MIAMRDGQRLYTQVYAPKAASGPLPILLLRTPYGTGDLNAARIAASLPELTAEGFIIAVQDIRGRFRSEGSFVMLRQPRERKDAKSIDEGTDTYDTIEWLLANVPGHNGRVGIAGTSYGAWLAVMAHARSAPGSQSRRVPGFSGRHVARRRLPPQRRFRLSYGLEYVYRMESSKEFTNPAALIDTYDTYEWYLNLGPLANVDAKYFHGKLPTWNDFVNHPDYDAFWKRQAFAPWLTRVTVPTLNVAGWWDQEDFYGPLKIYELLEKHDSSRQNFLVVGPWNHGGWSRGDGQKLGRVDFGSATSSHYRTERADPVPGALPQRHRPSAA